MSFLDTYRRNVQRKSEEIAKLHSNKASEASKVATLRRRINTASSAISRSNSESTINSKCREIERLEKDIARSEKKIADIEKKVATKQKEKIREEQKVSKEEKRESDKKCKEAEKAERNRVRQMSNISTTLDRHNEMHKIAMLKLSELSELPEKITVLFLAANPLDQTSLRLDEEVREITEKVRGTKHRDSVHLVSCWAVRPLDILQAINEHQPTIIHFSGHGSSNELVFQDNNGGTKIVSTEAFIQTIMASSVVRLIFFNACHSYSQANALVQYVEAAIGMNDAIGDTAARIFAASFYSAIGFGLPLNQAFNQAKAALMLEGIQEDGVPELFVNKSLSSEEIMIVKPHNSKEIL